MKRFFNYFLHEIRMTMLSASTYVALVIFLLLMSLIYIYLLQDYSQSAHEDSIATSFFRVFWVPIFFMVPLLTMRSLAEERRLGTLESLLSTPINSRIVVLGKFLSAYIVYLLAWTMTLAFPYITSFVLPSGTVEEVFKDSAAVFGGFSFIAVSGMLYISLGLFASSLTRSQFVAGMLSFCFLFLVVVGGRLMLDLPFYEMEWLTQVKPRLDYLQTFHHLDDFSRGIIDSRPFFLYLSTATVVLGTTCLMVDAKKA